MNQLKQYLILLATANGQTAMRIDTSKDPLDELKEFEN